MVRSRLGIPARRGVGGAFRGLAAAERHLTGALAGLSAWIVTDGKAGDESQCLAVAEAAVLVPDIRRVAPRVPWSWLMPWGPPDPREAPGRGPLAGPFPAVAIGSGRRAVASIRALRAASGGRTFTVFLKTPRVAPSAFDVVWAPSHDGLAGPNVVTTLTSPHRVTPSRLAAARAVLDPRLANLPRPRIAVLVGGPARGVEFGAKASGTLLAGLRLVAAEGASLMVTASRRTPDSLRTALATLSGPGRGFVWDGTGENPHIAMLALADSVIVTADSVNMLSEAVATGAPVLAFEPGALPRRHRAFVDGLVAAGAVRPFAGRLDAFSYPPMDSTPVIAAALAAAYAEWRARRPTA